MRKKIIIIIPPVSILQSPDSSFLSPLTSLLYQEGKKRGICISHFELQNPLSFCHSLRLLESRPSPCPRKKSGFQQSQGMTTGSFVIQSKSMFYEENYLLPQGISIFLKWKIRLHIMRDRNHFFDYFCGIWSDSA